MNHDQADDMPASEGTTSALAGAQALRSPRPADYEGPLALGNPAPAVFPTFGAGAPSAPADAEIDRVLDIPVQLTVELGHTKIPIRNILQLAQGSVIELDGLAGEPMDVLVNGCLIAQGEVVVVNDRFGIRLTDIITPSERIRKLSR
jgi:flagellar motor switch protein FliN/FliY